MDQTLHEKRITRLFRLGVALKGAHAAIEMIGGVLLFVIPPATFIKIAEWMTRDELLDD